MKENERRSVAHAAAMYLQAAIEDIRDTAREIEARTGVQIVHPDPPPFTDATRKDLETARVSLASMLNAVESALKWVGPNTTLGRVLKTMPPDAAKELTEILKRSALI